MTRFWAMVAAILILDQLSKAWLLFHVGMIERPPIEVTSFFKLVMVWNEGISFGMFSRSTMAFMPWVLIGLALAVAFWLVRLARRSSARIERLGYALVVGGALGNVIDRVRFGAVADFFYFHIGDLGWPAFNVADAAICIGVGLLLLVMIKNPAKP